MPECGVDDCGISCEFGCYCVAAGASCECGCENETLKAEELFDGVVDPDAYVSFTAAEMPVSRLAEWFDFLFPEQILIPASKVRATITTDGVMREIKLGDLIKELGLTPAREPLVGRDLSKRAP